MAELSDRRRACRGCTKGKPNSALDLIGRVSDREENNTEYSAACAEPDIPEMSDRRRRRSNTEYRSLMNRLKRIEGQIRGIEGMLERDAYCPDILIQVSSVNSALNSFNKELMASHIKGCVANDIRNGDDEAIDELVKVMQKLMK